MATKVFGAKSNPFGRAAAAPKMPGVGKMPAPPKMPMGGKTPSVKKVSLGRSGGGHSH
jgi:hypothetical protein